MRAFLSVTAALLATLVLALPASAAAGVKWSVSVHLIGTDPASAHYTVVSTASTPTCAASVAKKTHPYGRWEPFIPYSSATGTSPWTSRGEFVVVVTDGYAGPGTYTSANSMSWEIDLPDHAKKTVIDRWTGSAGTLVVAANGGGRLTLDHATGTAGSESGAVSWTCRLA